MATEFELKIFSSSLFLLSRALIWQQYLATAHPLHTLTPNRISKHARLIQHLDSSSHIGTRRAHQLSGIIVITGRDLLCAVSISSIVSLQAHNGAEGERRWRMEGVERETKREKPRERKQERETKREGRNGGIHSHTGGVETQVEISSLYSSFRNLSLHYLATLVADIVSILPHGVLQRFLVELGGLGGDGVTVHLVLILQTHQTLPLHVSVQVVDQMQHISKLGVPYRSVLWNHRQHEAGSK